MRNTAFNFIITGVSAAALLVTAISHNPNSSTELSSSSNLPAKMICEDNLKSDVGYSTRDHHIELFNKDLRSKRQKKLSTEEKVERIEAAIRLKHDGADEYSPEQIARTIVWAAECTGSNLKYWAAILKHESYFCGVRLNRRGGDAGCGQFTTRALDELRHQLQVPSAGGTGSKIAKVAMRNMVKSCYESYEGWTDGSVAKGGYDNYMDFMNRPVGEFHKKRMKSGGTPFDKGTIKEALYNARAMHAGLLSSVLLLKFYTALRGGYTVPGTDPGGIASYNGGGVKNYYGRIKKEFQYLPVKHSCVSDDYTSQVMEAGCEMEIEEGYESCMKKAEQDRLGVKEIAI